MKKYQPYKEINKNYPTKYLFKIGNIYSTKGTIGEKGTGLGLTLTRQLIEQHGGILWVESELNVGTTFHFTIQAEPTASPTYLYLHEKD